MLESNMYTYINNVTPIERLIKKHKIGQTLHMTIHSTSMFKNILFLSYIGKCPKSKHLQSHLAMCHPSTAGQVIPAYLHTCIKTATYAVNHLSHSIIRLFGKG
jgi:hypothetical protein